MPPLRRDGVKDIDLYKGLQEAFTTMGFDAKARDDCLSCVATILALGNLEFEQISGAREDEKQVRGSGDEWGGWRVQTEVSAGRGGRPRTDIYIFFLYHFFLYILMSSDPVFCPMLMMC